jgi:hypothetical protein
LQYSEHIQMIALVLVISSALCVMLFTIASPATTKPSMPRHPPISIIFSVDVSLESFSMVLSRGLYSLANHSRANVLKYFQFDECAVDRQL